MQAPAFGLVNWLWLCAVICSCRCEEPANPLMFSTNDCFLTEPVYNHKFDFRGLHSELAHVATSGNGDIFEYNLCGNLTRSCDGYIDVAACLKRGGKEYVLGTRHQLTYSNGKMYFTYSNGAKCPNSTGEFKLHVFIGCDYTPDKVQSKVTSYANEACSFYITLETHLACLPEPAISQSNSCSVKDPQTGHTFDLLPLSDFNYRTSDRMGAAFVINICKPVLYSENAMCPPGSSVCFVALKSLDYKKKFYDYGAVQIKPVIENGQLLMRHTSNSKCGTENKNFTSIISFYCDKDSKSVDLKLVGVQDCTYLFSFFTPLACSDLAPCTAVTHGSEIIDMRPLQNKPFTLAMQDKNYTFDVCSNAGSPCLEEDGACLSLNGQSTGLGKSNAHLLFNSTGSPYLLYEGGAKCQKSSSSAATFWSTRIEFVCANNATKDNGTSALGPKIIENSNCQLLIHYPTQLACQEQITCKTKVYVEQDGIDEEEVVDLTPLISSSENYEAKIDTSLTEQQVAKSTKFFLNVCRPLVSKYGLGCPGGSAACMAKVDSSSPTPEEEKSLGYPMASLVAVNRTNAELRYLKGGPCPTDNKLQMSSGIEFYCDMRAGRGTPVLRTISDCHYQFVWATSVICPPHMCSFNPDSCEITNDEINVSYNLKKAPFTDGGKIKIPLDKGEHQHDMCGKHGTAQTDYAQGLVNLFSTAKERCGSDDIINVQMRMICSANFEKATTFSDGTQCNLIYIVRTPDICKFLGLAVPPATSTTTTTTTTTTVKPNDVTTKKPDEVVPHPAEQTGSIGAILAAILSLTCFVACFGILAFSPERRNSLRRLFRRSTSAVRYSRVQSNEEANLLLEPNGEFTDSDDDMLL